MLPVLIVFIVLSVILLALLSLCVTVVVVHKIPISFTKEEMTCASLALRMYVSYMDPMGLKFYANVEKTLSSYNNKNGSPYSLLDNKTGLFKLYDADKTTLLVSGYFDASLSTFTEQNFIEDSNWIMNTSNITVHDASADVIASDTLRFIEFYC